MKKDIQSSSDKSSLERSGAQVLLSNFTKLETEYQRAIINKVSDLLKDDKSLLTQANRIQVQSTVSAHIEKIKTRDYETLAKCLNQVPPPIAVLFNIEMGKQYVFHLE